MLSLVGFADGMRHARFWFFEGLLDMKRIVVVFLCLMAWTGASAQFVPDGVLKRHGSSLKIDGVRLTDVEQELVLSDIEGKDYVEVWNNYSLRRKAAIKDTIKGSVDLVGSAALLYGGVWLFKMTGASILLTIFVSALAGGGDPESQQEPNIDVGRTKLVLGSIAALDLAVVGGGIYFASKGISYLAGGVTSLIISGVRMNDIVKRYNYSRLPNDNTIGELSLGPTNNGFGLRLTF